MTNQNITIVPLSFVNRFGHYEILKSPLICSTQPLRFRTAWKVFHLDLNEGEISQLDSVSNSHCFFDTLEEAEQEIGKMSAEIKWSVILSRCRIDQFDRVYFEIVERHFRQLPTANTRKLRQLQRVDGLNISFEKLQSAHEVLLLLLAVQESTTDTSDPGDGFRNAAARFVLRECERAMLMMSNGQFSKNTTSPLERVQERSVEMVG